MLSALHLAATGKNRPHALIDDPRETRHQNHPRNAEAHFRAREFRRQEEGPVDLSSGAQPIGRNPPRLVLREQLGRRSPPWLILVIEIPKLLPAAVLHNVGSTDILN